METEVEAHAVAKRCVMALCAAIINDSKRLAKFSIAIDPWSHAPRLVSKWPWLQRNVLALCGFLPTARGVAIEPYKG